LDWYRRMRSTIVYSSPPAIPSNSSSHTILYQTFLVLSRYEREGKSISCASAKLDTFISHNHRYSSHWIILN
jgi:hypothetical protein